MDRLPLDLEEQSSVNCGRAKSGDIVACYEHRIRDGITESLLVSFLKDDSVEDGGVADVNETSLNAHIEYAAGFFGFRIKEQAQEHIPEIWEVFGRIFDQLVK
jgi:hypothetical protein